MNIIKQTMTFIFVVALFFGFTAASMAMEEGMGTKTMSADEQIKIAESAAPSSISMNATILVPGEDGKLVEARKGTNGFTCIPDIDGQEEPDPICVDQAAFQWVNDLMNKAPSPTNTIPGIAYMARGGWHWEKDGKLVEKNDAGALRVKEPPHWMIVGPFDSMASGLPTAPHKFGTYIMWDGTPYSHLMIYQDPNKLK